MLTSDPALLISALVNWPLSIFFVQYNLFIDDLEWDYSRLRIRLLVTDLVLLPILYPQSFLLLISAWAHFESFWHPLSLFSQSALLFSLICTSLSGLIGPSNPCTWAYEHTFITPTHTGLCSVVYAYLPRVSGLLNLSCNGNFHFIF